MQDSTSQLTASILLGSLSLIPNTALRYTALGLATCLGVLYAVYLKHPSTQLRQLEKNLATTEEVIRGAKAQCPRDQLRLAEEWIRFLEVKHSASVIKYNILEAPRLTWTQYRLLSRDMTEHIVHVKSIHTAVQLTIEAERQRKLAAEIDDAKFALCSSGHRGLPNSTDPSPYNSAYRSGFSFPVLFWRGINKLYGRTIGCDGTDTLGSAFSLSVDGCGINNFAELMT
ncbi:hypothetical protein DFH09DRAFT_1075490 [Mycena vulgaris]|nr:hypothetical protein DFH09DRAFT_1075490 [Mycena vulgaris]